MIELYLRNDCKFCDKVTAVVKELNLRDGIDFRVINSDQGTQGRKITKEIGGKEQFPFMVLRENEQILNKDVAWMYESSDIMDFLKSWHIPK